MIFIGEIAALLTSIFWAGSSVLFTLAGKQVGSIKVNRIRVILALLFLMSLNLAFYGYLLPFNAGVDRWGWFAVSGIIGYAMGDILLFQSFISVGPQLGMLMMSLAPLISAVLAWIFFGEILNLVQILGVMLALVGVIWVIAWRKNDTRSQFNSPMKGVLFGLGAAAGQSIGYILSKQGLTDNFSPIAGNSIRMLAAVIVLWALASIQGKTRETVYSLHEKPKVLGWLIAAAFIGPVLGATLSMFALQHTQVGIASTLIALPPVFLLPVSWLVFKEKFSWYPIPGTLVAIGGVALLFLASN